MWMLRTDSPASGLPGADCCMAGLPRLQCCILAPDALRLLAVREPGCHAVVNLVIVLQCTKLQADNQGWLRSCPRARNRARRVSAKGSEPGNEQRMESVSRKAQQVEAKAFGTICTAPSYLPRAVQSLGLGPSQCASTLQVTTNDSFPNQLPAHQGFSRAQCRALGSGSTCSSGS